MNTYSYPDNDDFVTSQYIQKNELYPGYWNTSEERIRKMIRNNIKNRLSQRTDLSLLDAGCGEGRLLTEFQELFHNITAIDPDEKRLQKARDIAHLSNFSDKVDFLNLLITDIDETKKYDVILCSHVVQHVHTDSLDSIFSKFQKLLKQNGLLFILTCHSVKESDYFTKSFVDQEPKEQAIGQDEFNRLVNAEGTLPAHFFTQDSISSLLLNSGFRPFEFQVFHCDRNLPGFKVKLADIDTVINNSSHYQRSSGRDLYIASTAI